MKKMSLGIVVLFCATALFTGCAGSKGSGASGEQEIEGDVNDLSKQALDLEKENHELKKEIFDLKRKLGIPTEE